MNPDFFLAVQAAKNLPPLWKSALRLELGAKPKTVPERILAKMDRGYVYTRAYFAEELGVSPEHASVALSMLKKVGLVELAGAEGYWERTY